MGCDLGKVQQLSAVSDMDESIETESRLISACEGKPEWTVNDIKGSLYVMKCLCKMAQVGHAASTG